MPSARKDRRIRLRRLIVVSIYLLVAAWTLCAGLRPNLAVLYLLLSVAIADAMTAWCVLDSQILGRPILRTFYFLIFLAWPVAVPIYFIWSRKLFGLALAVAHGLGLAVMWLACALLPYLLAWQMASRGWAAIEDGDPDRAVSLLGRAVEIDVHNPTYWHALGAAYEAEGQLPFALGAYRRALWLDGQLHECRQDLYWCLCDLACDAQSWGYHDQAAVIYRQAIALDHTEPTAWYKLAISYEALGNFPAAVDAAQKACSLDPDNEDFRAYFEFLKAKPPAGYNTTAPVGLAPAGP
jgi:tetratricopeptide (TPR) repeat protein